MDCVLHKSEIPPEMLFHVYTDLVVKSQTWYKGYGETYTVFKDCHSILVV